jgi:hypothetical protein
MSTLDFSRNGSNFNSSLFASGNGNGWHQNSSGLGIEQLLTGGSEPQLQPSMTLPDAAAAQAAAAAAAAAAALPAPQTYAPIPPQQQQQQQPADPALLKLDADLHRLPTYQPQQQMHQEMQQQWQQAVPIKQQQQQMQVQLPPGLWLVAPTAHEQVSPVVQQAASPTAVAAAAAAAAANNGVLAAPALPLAAQQQQGRKRQLRLPAQPGHKGARISRSSSPATAAAAAKQPLLRTFPKEGGAASLTNPAFSTMPAAAAAAAGKPEMGGRGATSAVGAAVGQIGVGSLVWGKVNR